MLVNRVVNVRITCRFMPQKGHLLLDDTILCGLLVHVLFTTIAERNPGKSAQSLRNGQKYLDAVKRKVLRDKKIGITAVDQFLGDLVQGSKYIPRQLWDIFNFDEIDDISCLVGT